MGCLGKHWHWTEEQKKRWSETRKRMFSSGSLVWSGGMTGKHHTEASNLKNSESNKGRCPSYGMLGKKHSEDQKQNLSDIRKRQWQNPEYRQMMLKARQNPATEIRRRRKISKTLKEKWQNPEFARMIFISWRVTPTKPEKLVNEILFGMYLGEYKYTGDGSFSVGGKCPDFVNVNGQKKIIEVHGVYWHSTRPGISREQAEKERKEHFAKYGFKTLVIWEDKLTDFNAVVKKIQEFVEI